MAKEKEKEKENLTIAEKIVITIFLFDTFVSVWNFISLKIYMDIYNPIKSISDLIGATPIIKEAWKTIF